MELGSGKPPERPEQPEGPPAGQPRPPDSPRAPEPPAPPEGPPSGPKAWVERLRRPRVAAAIGIALAAVIIAVLVLGGGDDGGSQPAASGEPEQASVADLQDLADSVGHPVYWVGEKEGKRYELTVSDEGNVFIRYLDPGTEIGSRDVASTTIGTYPVPNAYAAVRKIADQPGAISSRTPDGGLVAAAGPKATSVYIAYPGSDIQIEVYDPDPAVALEIATSGAVEPIE